MKWTDVYDIAIVLEEKFPDEDIINIKFTNLWKMVQALPKFDDSPDLCNEKILESIQATWLEERD